MQRLDPQRRAIAYAAAALAGFVDATGFLATDRYFVSFMSGNTTRLGVDLAAGPKGAGLAALLIAGFVCGVIGGALVAVQAAAWRKPAVLALCAVLLALAGTLAAVLPGDTPVVLLLVLAMGVLNNTFQRSGGEASIGLTYMTGALVRFGQGIAARLSGGRDAEWLAWLGLWSALAMGALGGALAWPLLGWNGLWAAAGMAALLAAVAARKVGRR